MKISASQVVMECLLEQGVDTVFGYPGGTILNIYDELELHGYGKKIRHILTAHEQGASHAADGYARSTGKVGVCFATSGPGATNLVTGIATAYMDSSPVVFITVNVGESLIGKDTFQEVDITGITLPITKCNYLVKDATKLADIIREAFAIARSGRPGPVLIDILKNVTSEEVDFTPLPLSEHHRHGRLAALLARNSDGLNMKIPEPDHGDVQTSWFPCWTRPRSPSSWWAAASSAAKVRFLSSVILSNRWAHRSPPPSWAAAPVLVTRTSSPA